MKIGKLTKIEELLKAYPFLEDFLPTISREYRLLKNKMVRKTIGKFATLERVAAIGKVPLESLLDQIAAKIKEVTHEEVQLEIEGKISVAKSHEARREEIKRIIKDIHAGKDVEKIKSEFSKIINDIGAHELAQVEQELIGEGLRVEEVQGLCNIHSNVFEDGLARQSIPGVPAGHPVHVMLLENRELEKKIAEIRKGGIDSKLLSGQLEDLKTFDIHYIRKENQLFPQLEHHGITGPSQVMWGKHDEIRKLLKSSLKEDSRSAEILEKLLVEMEEMITKEEKILTPMALEVLSDQDWSKVQEGEIELGYAWIEPRDEWKPIADRVDIRYEETEVGELKLEVGHMSPELLSLMLSHLPIEISFVNEHDEVVYYNQTNERIFPRTPAVIGRKVQNCHPQNSVHIVNHIVQSFKNGEKDVAEFWIEMKGMFLHIRYFAVRNKAGEYKGCLEATQNVTHIRGLEGEKRLLEWV